MEVNVIFAESVKIDERNNFRLDLQNDNNIINLLLNRKKDYYLTNAITFLQNEIIISKEIKDLEDIAKEHLDAEEKDNFKTMVNLNIQLDFLQDKSLSDRRVVPYWEYKHDENDMKKIQKRI